MNISRHSFSFHKGVAGAAFILALFAFPLASAHAQEDTGASLFLSPAGGTFSVGSTFTINLNLDTGGKFINAVEAYLTFPPEKLQVVSPTTGGKSFIEIWASPPTYSNREGTLSFQGGVHKPGINVQSGIVASITFRVKEVGNANIRVLSNSRVFLGDGTGRDILTKTSGGVYALVLPPPAGPLIASRTHPNQEKWYKENLVVFQWDTPQDIQGYSYALSRNPVEEPDNISEGIRGNLSYNDLPDGIHYFHIKALRAGSWGGVTHYAIKIDSTPPAEFPIEISPSKHTSQRKPIISFTTTDTVSGIDHYELKIIRVSSPDDVGDTSSDTETPFFIEVVSPYSQNLTQGKYHVVVQAFDRAQNMVQTTTDLTITNAMFDVIRNEGIVLFHIFTIPWLLIFIFGFAILVILLYLMRRVIVLRRKVEEGLRMGATGMPHVSESVMKLREKQKEYGHLPPGVGALLIGFVALGILWSAAVSAQTNVRAVNPPLISLLPETISNDEILYVGGHAGVPNAEVLITLQENESGESTTHIATTDKNGAWFYSFERLLDPGQYELWTQLRVGQEVSVPSARRSISVAHTALQFGNTRISYERVYLVLFLLMTLTLIVFAVVILFSHRTLRKNRAILQKEIREAEESVRRGFALLRKDIQAELALVHQMKASRELSAQEKIYEEKLLKDLEWASAYIGKEVWDIEQAQEHN